MRIPVHPIFALALAMTPAVGVAQQPIAATYITDEEIKAVNALPGVDRQIRVVDIGSENFAVGIIHRGKTGVPPAPTQAALSPSGQESCGEGGSAPADGVRGVTHNGQTEGYMIVSGGGTLVTGGKLLAGHVFASDSPVTTTLNGPSCSGVIGGPDVVRKAVKTGDVIIIPAGVPHGWTDISDHVDYISFRPSGHLLQAGYVNPAIRK